MNATSVIAGIVARCKQIQDTPEYQANAEKLAREADEFSAVQRDHERRNTLRHGRIPKETWPFLDSPGVTTAVLAAQEFVAGSSVSKDGKRPRFLLLAGPNGQGKTVAAAWCVYQRGGRYFTQQEIVTAGSFDRPLLTELATVPMLALDELGGEKPNDANDATLYELLNGRYRRDLPSVLVTNCDLPAFRQRYGEGPMYRLIERIETGGLVSICRDGPSMRNRS